MRTKPVILFLLFLTLLFWACGDDDAATADLSVSFTANGTDFTWTKGFSEPEFGGVAFGNAIGTIGTIIHAMPTVAAYSNGAPDSYILFSIEGVSAGTYILNHSTSDAFMDLVLPGGLNYSATNLTVTVTAYGAVGGVISGTFSGFLDDGSPLTGGTFTVRRLADSTFDPG